MSHYSIDDQVLSLPFQINHLNLKTTLIILIWLKYTIRASRDSKKLSWPSSGVRGTERAGTVIEISGQVPRKDDKKGRLLNLDFYHFNEETRR